MSLEMSVDPIGDVDRDFVAMMIPHTQGAIDMARVELKHGFAERENEISHMRSGIGNPLREHQ
jgi:uncharacterized protein (DUF305 family)